MKILTLMAFAILLTIGLGKAEAMTLCANDQETPGDLYVQAPAGKHFCWKKLPRTQSLELKAPAGVVHFRYVGEHDTDVRSVLIVKELISIPPSSPLYAAAYVPTLSTIRLQRDRIVSTLCKNRDAFGKILRSSPGSFADASLVAYLKYHRLRNGILTDELRQFHFEYEKVVDGVVRCMRTDDSASGNRRAYDFPGLMPDVGGSPMLALGRFFGLVAFAAGISERPPTSKEVFVQVRHFPLTFDRGVRKYVDFWSEPPEAGTLQEIWLKDLDENVSRDLAFGRHQSISWIE